MTRPRRVTVYEQAFVGPEDLHAFLGQELGFPEWYGANLDALEDCLGDIYTPTRLVLVRSSAAPRPWFDGFVDTVCAAAQRSCYVGCIIREDG